METNDEMIDKLKASVIAKLDELDSSKKHDSTLVDYILVMVVNQKNKFEMKHNLALFIGKIVDDFVNWLFDYLAQLKEDGEQIANKSVESVSPTTEQHTSNNATVKVEDQNNEKITQNKVVVKPNQDNNNKKTLKSSIVSRKVDEKNNKSEPPPTTRLSKKRTIICEEENAHKKRPKSEIIDSRTLSGEMDDDDDPSSVGISDDASKENTTKFLVTLNGVEDFYKTADNDVCLFDEDFDPELMKEDLSNFNQKSIITKDASIKESNQNKLAERCKYWPTCINGSKCEFFHPKAKCNTFPYCRFGDKCFYIHPLCKFDSMCSRKDCPFLHPTPKRGGGGGGGPAPHHPASPPVVTCKYHPNCRNPGCEFYHPPNKVCHYGAACKSFNCPFTHPGQNIPHPSKLKWSSKNNASLEISNKEEIEIK